MALEDHDQKPMNEFWEYILVLVDELIWYILVYIEGQL